MGNNKAVFTKDTDHKMLKVTRAFDAPLDEVWTAWTTSEMLDQWWAPKPYKAVTKTLDFKEGGQWMYKMQAPDGSGEWCKEEYKKIVPQKSINSIDMFCDEAGNKSNKFPQTRWKKEFSAVGNSTNVNIELTYDSAEDMEMILKMGFQQGFTAGLDNLDEVLAK